MKRIITNNAEYIEAKLKEKSEQITKLKFEEPKNDWIIDKFELLLNCYPILRKFNYKTMSLEELQALIESLFNHLEMQYSEDGELIIVDLTEQKTLLPFKELMLWILLALLKDRSHVHLKFNEKLFNDMKVSESNVIDYLCDNSRFIANGAKQECHFILSVAAILGCDYYNQDLIITSLVAIQQYYKKDMSLKDYIDYRKTAQNINNKPRLKLQSSIIKINL